MKKTMYIILAASIFCSVITGCGKSDTTIKKKNVSSSTEVAKNKSKVLKNGIHVNQAYDKEKMVTISGREINKTTKYTYCDKELGFGFINVGAFQRLKETGRMMGTIGMPNYAMLGYASKECDNIAKKYPEEVYKKLSEQEKKNISKKYDQETLNVVGIFRLPDNADSEAKSSFDLFSSKYEKVEELLKYNGATYYFGYSKDYSKLTLTDEEKTDVDELVKNIDEFKQNIVIYPPVSREETERNFEGNLNKFTADTLNGKKVTQDILKKYDLTMVNIWATTCGPCIEEMPEIAKLYKNLPKNVNVLSICIDGKSDVELTKKIIEDAKGEFDVIFPDENIQKSLTSKLTAVPTTVFVDKNGNLVDKPLFGVPDPKTASKHYLKKINELLNKSTKSK